MEWHGVHRQQSSFYYAYPRVKEVIFSPFNEILSVSPPAKLLALLPGYY
jgi:hypothetical protein